eukprot:Pgem_evm1s898
MKVITILLALTTSKVFATGNKREYPQWFDCIPTLYQITSPPSTTEYPQMPGNLFDDRQILKIDVHTDTEPQNDNKFVNSKIRIESMDQSYESDDILTKLDGLHFQQQHNPLKDYYFQTRSGERDIFGEWDSFSIKKSLNDHTLLREKMGADLTLALGFLPRYMGWASVTVNGQYLGIYNTIQRMEKQWLHRTYGHSTSSGYDRGSHYEAKRGNLGDLNSVNDVTKIFNVKFANKLQNNAGGTLLPGNDIYAFANLINSLKNDPYLETSEKELLRVTIDYDNYAKAAALDYYSGDPSGYFYGQNKNYEWYHDITDGRWKVLRWELGDGFHSPVYGSDRLYTLANANTNQSVPVLQVLLKDDLYVELYQSYLWYVATYVLPAYTGVGRKPDYVKRLETYYNRIISKDKAVWDRTICPNNIECVQNVTQMTTITSGVINGITARTNQVLNQSTTNSWVIYNLTTLEKQVKVASLSSPKQTVKITPMSVSTRPWNSSNCKKWSVDKSGSSMWIG